MQVTIEKFPFTERVPQLIHQTHFTRDVPEKVAENLRKLKSLNPDWDYRFYDDDVISIFIAQHYGEDVLGVFDSINPDYDAARADLFRYLALYRLGGVYLDIKSTADRPLTEVIHPGDSFILSQWRNRIGEPYPKWAFATAFSSAMAASTTGRFSRRTTRRSGRRSSCALRIDAMKTGHHHPMKLSQQLT